MRTRSKIFFLIILIMTLLVSACGPEDRQGIENILDPDNSEPSEAQRKQMAGEGSADVYYHYYIETPDLYFKIDMPFHIIFVESDQNPGTFEADGIFEDWVTLKMAASGGPTGRCEYNCEVMLRFVATGSIALGEGGECQIPMNFSFVPEGGSIIDTTCPAETLDVVNCDWLAMVMLDPTTYTFLKTDTELYVPSDPGVTREAEIKNLVFPADMAGTCKW